MDFMKKINLKILIIILAAVATIALHVPTVYADGASDNKVEVNESNYKINDGEEVNYSPGSIDAVAGGVSSETSATAFDADNPIIAGSAESGDANYNTVIINGGTIFNYAFTEAEDDEYEDAVIGGYAENGNANYNTVTINDGNISAVVGGYIDEDGNANYNTVNINGGYIRSVTGAEVTLDGNVSNNTVNIFNGTINDGVFGASAGDGIASNNTVNIMGGTINGVVIGADSSSVEAGDDVPDDELESYYSYGNVTDNTVNIYDGSINGDVYGGFANMGSATNNTINLYGGTFGGNLYGGYSDGGGNVIGNTLNVYATDLRANNVYNFDSYNFYIPSTATNGSTMLTLTDTNGTDLSGTSIKAGVMAGSNLQSGDSINLITNANGLTTTGTTYGKLTEGVSTDFDLTIEQNGNNLVATIGQGQSSSSSSTPTSTRYTNPGTELFTEAPITALKLGNWATDQLIHDFDFEDIEPIEPEKEDRILINSGAHSFRTNTGYGSILRSKGSIHNLGFARTFKNHKGKLVFAPVIQYGHDNYHSYLSNGMHGSGSAKYTAGGFIARQINTDGFYYEGSIRVGQSDFDFGSSDFDGYDRVSYKTHAPIFAGHVRLGKLMRLDRNNLMHIYGIYAHSRLNGMTAHLSSGEHYNFRALESSRFRAGYKLTTQVSKISYLYTGMAYQYESNPNSSAMYAERDMKVPKSGSAGSSGMLEIGWQIKPLKTNPWMVDINTTGWVGNQKGITAMVKLKKSF